jgi:[protein-PII] uridylyltransferase
LTPGVSAAPDRSLAAALAAAREEYAADARRGHGGRDAAARYSGRIDELVAGLAAAARRHTATRVAVCALGGYGRRTLSLHSDIDLLILFEGGIEKPEASFVNAVLQPLWDLRLTVGHHVRELGDFDRADTGNPEFLLAMLDARLIGGSEALFDRLVERFQTSLGDGRVVVDALRPLVEERHARFNGTPYHLEPDLKNAPGGLRDIVAVRTLQSVLLARAGEAAGSPVLHADAEEFMLRVRALLHVAAGRDANVLTHETQEKLAEVLAGGGTWPHQRVEMVMGEYFRHARTVSRALAASLASLGAPRDSDAPRRLGKHLEATAGGVRFADPVRAAAYPALWVEAFRVGIVRGCAVSLAARRCIEENLSRFDAEDFVATEAERHQLRHLLFPRPGLYARLSEMHDCGLLERIFPEIERIHSRVTRDFYHKYTVDEHTLLAIRNLELLRTTAERARQRLKSLLAEVHAPELITLALLYHDTGKWRGEEHVTESLRLADAMFERLQLPEEARRTVEFLIRNHLEMSRVAFRQDTEDPEVVGRFASIVGNEERLKALYLMTFADIGAVSSDTLTPWKEELLWRLYVDTYNRLTLEYADELIRKDGEVIAGALAARPADIPEQELVGFLKGLPRRYLSLFDLPTVFRHVRLARELHPDEVHSTIERRDAVWELTVVTLDRPFLFSNIAGVLSYFGMDIHRGQALTTEEGLVLDVFEFTDDERFLRQNPSGGSDISRALRGVVAGSIDVTSLLAGKERSVVYRRRRRVPPLVSIDNEHSNKYTVIEIVADDGVGLLYRISRVISEYGCSVHLVLISTEGGKATDVLHVTKDGGKLSAADQAGLRGELQRMLEGIDEAHQEHHPPQQGG